MSDQSIPQPAPVPTMPPAPPERVLLGLAAATVAIIASMGLTIIVWRAGFVAGITSFVLAVAAAEAYKLAARAQPRRGLLWLLILIVVGTVASFFAIVASDLWDVYSDLAPHVLAPPSRFSFIEHNVFKGRVLKAYSGKDIGLFALFAVLGIFGTLRRLAASHPANARR